MFLLSNRRYGITSVFGGLLVGLFACSSGPEPAVFICNTATQSEPCQSTQHRFTTGQSLSAHLVADEPLVAQTIIGKILRLVDTDTIPLGTRIITPEPDQRTIVQTLPFHEFGAQAAGTFLIQFVDERNQVIAEKKITIK